MVSAREAAEGAAPSAPPVAIGDLQKQRKVDLMRFEIFSHSKGGSAPDRISAEPVIPIPTRGEAMVYSPSRHWRHSRHPHCKDPTIHRQQPPRGIDLRSKIEAEEAPGMPRIPQDSTGSPKPSRERGGKEHNAR
jgi:hypothetical protein